jgi:hypothetical protein
MEKTVQKWPYADFTHVNVEHFRSLPQKESAQKWEYLIVQAVFVAKNHVMFFDHYANEYKRQRDELDAYLHNLGADGWKLTFTGNVDREKYQFRRYHFRRAIE